MSDSAAAQSSNDASADTQRSTVSPSPNPNPKTNSNGTRRKRHPKPPATTSNSTTNTTAAQRELLTPHQKQANHRNAETRRRQEIQERLTKMCDEFVPGAKGLAKSPELAYTKAYEYIRDQLLNMKELIAKNQALGLPVPESALEAVKQLEAFDAISSDDTDDEEDAEADDGWEDSEGEGDDRDSDEGKSEGEEEDDENAEEAVTAAVSLNQMKGGGGISSGR